jgi:hypothetical protein
MNAVRNKCDEIDHHPEWQLKDNVLRVRLTSHFKGNNLSPKDYELAAIMNRIYEENISVNINKTFHKYFVVALSFGFVGSILAFVISLRNLKKRRFTSMDFVLPKVELSSNEYFKN